MEGSHITELGHTVMVSLEWGDCCLTALPFSSVLSFWARHVFSFLIVVTVVSHQVSSDVIRKIVCLRGIVGILKELCSISCISGGVGGFHEKETKIKNN